MRGSRGAPKIASGGPCSRIVPPSRKQTRSAISRAKLISCVAISIVMPPAASSRITSSTSATSSGSRALVTSSSSISSRLHRERTDDRDALLLAAREPVRVLARLVAEAEALEQLERARLRLPPRQLRAPRAARA